MNNNIWTFRYEPQTLDEMVLQPDIRDKFKKALKEVPNLMLVGPPGVGKGTYANIFLRETKLDHYKVNCSEETSIDNVRTKIKSFATALGITPIKVVVLNEIDFLSLNAQAMLRDFIESVQNITRFIMMCNYGHKVIPELQSRCQVIELGAPPAADIYKFCMSVLEKEKVTVKNKKEIVEMIKKLYPDIRRMVNTLQLNTINGVIDSVSVEELSKLYESILAKIKLFDLDGTRKILKSHMINYPELYNYLYENVDRFKNPGDAIILIGKHLYQDSIVAIKEINFMAMVLEMMKANIV
jgi:DNA polymerase III delta prime subunit